MTRTLRRVLLRRPGGLERWREYGWRAEPDAAAIAREHEALCSLLAEAGTEVVLAAPLDGNPDAVYVFDPALVADEGLVLLTPGKELRRAEAEPLAAALPEIPVAARLGPDELAEGGDTLWLDERTLIVGRSYRTNDAGIDALRRALPGVEVLPFDLPHLRGAGEVLHLLSLVSPLDDDLAVVYLPLLPARLVELLSARGIRLVEVPDGLRSRSKGIPRRAGGWSAPGSRCWSTRAGSSRRAKAARPASRVRCCAGKANNSGLP